MAEPQPPASQEHVDAWLASEGYPLEYYVAACFRAAGFRVFQGEHVRVKSDEKPREIDVVASISRGSGQKLLRCSNVIECKWSRDKPWIVFTSGSGGMANSAVLAQTICNDQADVLMWIAADYSGLLGLSLFSAPERPGFGGRQAFTKSDLFYASMAGVTSAAVGICEQTNSSPKWLADGIPKLDFALVTFPMIVVDGILYEARYDGEDDRIVTSKTNHVRCHWRGAPSWPLHATVDVVTREGLADFVAQRREDIDVLMSNLGEARALLEKAIAAKDLGILNLGREPRGRGSGPAILKVLRQLLK